MAHKEASLIIEGHQFVNQLLQHAFPHRTLESIKGQRRRADYKDAVQRCLEELNPSAQTVDPVGTAAPALAVESDLLSPIRSFLSTLPPLRGHDFHVDVLNRILARVKDTSPSELKNDIAFYIGEIFPPRLQAPRLHKQTPHITSTSKRKQRRVEYARTQRLFKKNPGRCIGTLLEDISHAPRIDRNLMEPYWTAVFESAPTPYQAHRDNDPEVPEAWAPISADEIKVCFPRRGTSSGPDDISCRAFRAVPIEVLVRVFNIFLLCGELPETLCKSAVTFIPKTPDPTSPAHFRPIAVSSVITRTFHKILANRLLRLFPLDIRQRGFINADGCGEASFLLDLVLRYHHKNYKSMFLASIDIRKAFDCISHEAIFSILRSRGAPSCLVEYIRNFYAKSSVVLRTPEWTSRSIHPARGVRQGDPLSPFLFDIVMDTFLRSLPGHYGIRADGLNINALAYADDLLLMATTAEGLQDLLNIAITFFTNCGMDINIEKSFIIALRADGKAKKVAVDARTSIFCKSSKLRALRRTDSFTYLGVLFSPEGRLFVKPYDPLRRILDRLTAAPLKPQQRLWALRCVILPKFYHQLILGHTTIGCLNKMDCAVRCYVRRWLNLHHDVPNAYIHATVPDGGLGVASLRWIVPSLRLKRLHTLSSGDWRPELTPGSFWYYEALLCHRRLKPSHNTPFEDTRDIKKYWAQKLYASVDGAALTCSSSTPAQNRWVSSGNRFLSGRDFVNACRLRINALPSKSRTARGRGYDRNCRAGCARVETTNHILQACHRTHAERIRRHDAIVTYLARNLTRSGYNVSLEPRFVTAEGVRKPDIVANLGDTTLIMDAQVTSDTVSLTASHRRKADYYGQNDTLLSQVRAITHSTTILVLAVTLSWRGIWCPESAKKLLDLGIIRKRELSVLSTRVLIGGLSAFWKFNRTTMMPMNHTHTARRGIG